jgi:hypothetical protein
MAVISINHTLPRKPVPASSAALAQAAANPANWREIKASKPEGHTRKNANAAELVDAAMLALLDLTPECLGWRVVDLCERLITPKTETTEHMEALTELLGLIPPSLQWEGIGQIMALMQAAGRQVVTFNGPFTDRTDILRKGWEHV